MIKYYRFTNRDSENSISVNTYVFLNTIYNSCDCFDPLTTNNCKSVGSPSNKEYFLLTLPQGEKSKMYQYNIYLNKDAT